MSRMLICGLTVVLICGTVLAEGPPTGSDLSPAGRAPTTQAMLKIAAARWRSSWERYIANELESEDEGEFRYCFLSEPNGTSIEQEAFFHRICEISGPSGQPLLDVLASDRADIQPFALICVWMSCCDEEFPRERAIELVIPLVDSSDEVLKRSAEVCLEALIEVSDPQERTAWQKAKQEWIAREERDREAKRRQATRRAPVVAPRPQQKAS